MKKNRMLLLTLSFVLAACSANNPQTPATNTGGNTDVHVEEESDMKTEFCEVEKITKDVCTLKNTLGEIYYIDIELVEDFKEGDKVVLIYRSRTALAKGGYVADVYAIYADDDSIGDIDTK